MVLPTLPSWGQLEVYTLVGLACINVEGKDTIRAAVVELEKAGCVQRQITDKDRKFVSAEYVVGLPETYELPPERRPAAQLLSGNSMTGELSTVVEYT